MKNLIALLCIASFIFPIYGQHKEVRKLSSHQSISVATSLDVLYIPSNRNEIVLDCANRDHLQLILTDVKDGNLQIQYKPNSSVKSSKQNKVIIYSNYKVHTVKVSSSSKLRLESEINANTVNITTNSSGKFYADRIKANTINLDLSSSGQLEAAIATKTLNIAASSSGKGILKGEAVSANVNMSSSAKLDLDNVTISSLSCDGSSSARLQINTAKTLKSKLSSSATLSYSKEPAKIVENKTSSSGRLLKKS